MSVKLFVAMALSSALCAPADAATFHRYTVDDHVPATLEGVLARVNKDTGTYLTVADFRLDEDRALAFARYQRFDQLQQGIRIKGAAVRLWTTLGTKRTGPPTRLLQAEASVESVSGSVAEADIRSLVVPEAAQWRTARDIVRGSDDPTVRSSNQELVWEDNVLVRIVTIKARRGTHLISLDAVSGRLVRHNYRPFPNIDKGIEPEYYSVPALVYPVYEEYKGSLLPRQPVVLDGILGHRPEATSDPFDPLRTRRYLENMIDNEKAETPEGQAQGYWSPTFLMRQGADLVKDLPVIDNHPATGNALLVGRFVTINIHPDAVKAFPGTSLPLSFAPHLVLDWFESEFDDPNGGKFWEAKPRTPFGGQPFDGENAILARDARRDPRHDPRVYMTTGFDEVQVYWAVNQLFATMRPHGFTDPDLAERPFHAFLFNPDVESKDNAFYDSDTINFATYSPESLNYARDNTTIWHELGHGVMDRLMGTELNLDDTGGLSEGMADFIAALVLRLTYGAFSFPGDDDQRIINDTGFYLTNEVHDDGEAYGGTMNAILDLAVNTFGERGAGMTADLVLEAMRLSRDHPALTADDWFTRLRYADRLGRPGVRAPGVMAPFIDAALAARNFAPVGQRATFNFAFQGQSVDAGTPGSRGHPITVELTADQSATKEIEVGVADGETYKFVFPIEARVFFNSGPLQGAIDWEGEDAEPLTVTLNGPNETQSIPLTFKGRCDFINRVDGTCSDFAYVQIYNNGAAKPVAKKRFYLRVKTLE